MNSSTNNQAVNALKSLHITGNIIPNNWYKNIIRENGKPYLLAIVLLSDIVYWYRPEEVRDEASGNTIGWRKKFKDDLLQKSYQSYADFLGESKRSIKAALDYLEDLGVIKKTFRDYFTESNSKIPNVMYIELFPKKLEELTFDDEEKKPQKVIREKKSHDRQRYVSDKDDSNTIQNISDDRGGTKFCTTPHKGMRHLQPNDVRESTTECTTLLQNNVGYDTTFRGTNTKNTTENTNINNNPIYPSFENNLKDKKAKNEIAIDQIDKDNQIQKYEKLIKENIKYDYYIQHSDKLTKTRYEELYQIIRDVVCYREGKIKIGQYSYYPHDVVRSQFLKLNSNHILYVIDCLNKTKKEGRKIDNYLITSLYKAPMTIDNYYQQQVQHNLRISDSCISNNSKSSKKLSHQQDYEQRIYSDEEYSAFEKKKLGIT